MITASKQARPHNGCELHGPCSPCFISIDSLERRRASRMYLERKISGNVVLDKQSMLDAARRSRDKLTLTRGANACRSSVEKKAVVHYTRRNNLAKSCVIMRDAGVTPNVRRAAPQRVAQSENEIPPAVRANLASKVDAARRSSATAPAMVDGKLRRVGAGAAPKAGTTRGAKRVPLNADRNSRGVLRILKVVDDRAYTGYNHESHPRLFIDESRSKSDGRAAGPAVAGSANDKEVTGDRPRRRDSLNLFSRGSLAVKSRPLSSSRTTARSGLGNGDGNGFGTAAAAADPGRRRSIKALLASKVLLSSDSRLRVLRRSARGYGSVMLMPSAVHERQELETLASRNVATLQVHLTFCPRAVHELYRVTLTDRLAFQGLTCLEFRDTCMSQTDILNILCQLRGLQVFRAQGTLDNGPVDLGPGGVDEVESSDTQSIDRSTVMSLTCSKGSSSGGVGSGLTIGSAGSPPNGASRKHKYTLTELSLDVVAVNNSSLDEFFLCNVLRGCARDLQLLSLKACGFELPLTKQFSRAVAQLKSIREIRLASTAKDHLPLVLSSHETTLQRLALEGIGLHLDPLLGPVAIAALTLRGLAGVHTDLSVIAPCLAGLTQLSVEFCPKLSTPGLINVLQHSPQLAKLSLYGSAVTDHLAHALADTNLVPDLDVGLSLVTDEGFLVLSGSSCGGTTRWRDGCRLKILRCYGCRISNSLIKDFDSTQQPRAVYSR